MAYIIINGMEMPKNEPLLIKLNPDGSVSTTAKNGYRKYAAFPAADVEPVQEWISVNDRLPDAGVYVVCIAKRNPFSRFMPMVARIEKNGWVNPITEQYISEVTHWMPLPEPPKRGRWEEADWIEPDCHSFEAIRTPKAALRCSNCKNCFKKELLWKDNFCPNCGVKMEGGAD